jgi:hypothetical protein
MTKLFTILTVALVFANNGFAADFRVFFYVRDKHGLHGPSDVDPKRPSEVSMSAASASAARRIILQDYSNAVQIEIHRQ